MFKNKAFLISLALLAFNFLLPNQVRSSPNRIDRFDVKTVGKNITVNFTGDINRRSYKNYRCVASLKPTTKKTLKELQKKCKLLKDPRMKKLLEVEVGRALLIAK